MLWGFPLPPALRFSRKEQTLLKQCRCPAGVCRTYPVPRLPPCWPSGWVTPVSVHGGRSTPSPSGLRPLAGLAEVGEPWALILASAAPGSPALPSAPSVPARGCARAAAFSQPGTPGIPCLLPAPPAPEDQLLRKQPTAPRNPAENGRCQVQRGGGAQAVPCGAVRGPVSLQRGVQPYRRSGVLSRAMGGCSRGRWDEAPSALPALARQRLRCQQFLTPAGSEAQARCLAPARAVPVLAALLTRPERNLGKICKELQADFLLAPAQMPCPVSSVPAAGMSFPTWCLHRQDFVFSTGENFVADKIEAERESEQEKDNCSRGLGKTLRSWEEISTRDARVGWRQPRALLRSRCSPLRPLSSPADRRLPPGRSLFTVWLSFFQVTQYLLDQSFVMDEETLYEASLRIEPKLPS